MTDSDNDPIVEHPTWYAQIRYFFTEIDISHMQAKAIDLSNYQNVVDNAVSIYGQTSSGTMPPAPLPQWSANRVQTFLNWITDNCPLGTPEAVVPQRLFAAAASAPRIRKELSTLDADELATLTQAFEGMMARPASEPDSYFAIAGVHWYPAIDVNPAFHCLHHENRFLAWHRYQLLRFEDAMRSVPGCEDVTLPYWDMTTSPPAMLFAPPFATYTANGTVGHGYDPLVTDRYDAETIMANMTLSRVPDQIAAALRQATWEQFNRTLWGAHDNGHVACGTTMENQDISAFDPIFWFFHCDLDRIWLQWQRAVGATTLSGFKSTCTTSTAWLDIPALGVLPPFAGTAPTAITLDEVDYEAPTALEGVMPMAFENKQGNVGAAGSFRIDAATPLSVRVKDIDRSNIPGTFVVHLFADGEEVARQAFFQPTEPRTCSNCSENAKVSVDLRVDPAQVVDKELRVEIHVPRHIEEGTRFPLSKAGNPTINVRHLLEGG